MQTALVAGSTGLIGSQLLELLLKSDDYSKVIAISRKKLEITNPKLVNVVCELNQLSNFNRELIADDIFCCLGTTMKVAKSKEKFRAVDFDAPLALAKNAKENGAKKFLLISALGANKNSSIFYNQVKGEIEEAIQQVGLNTIHIFRPSLLIGSRKEQRSGEEAAILFYKVFGWLIPKKYKGIESVKVANAMLSLTKENQPGVFIHESEELQAF